MTRMQQAHVQSTAGFYDEWLGLWEKNEEEKKRARKAIQPEELEWVRTRQDAKAALLVSPQTGFRSSGTVTMIAEIPPGWHTGKHSHGEEALYILDGEKGFSIVNNQRYDWEKGACMRIPFGAVHQHFNTGSNPVKYYSAMAPYLESLALVAKFEQFEDCGVTTAIPTASVNQSHPDHDDKGRRILLHAKDAPVTIGGENLKSSPKTAFSESHPLEMRDGDKEKGHHARSIHLMDSTSDFLSDEVELTNINCEAPGTHSGKHAHMEAILYVLQGEGYTIIDGEKVPWKPGTCMHIAGPQTVHQHFNTCNIESQHLRAHSGIRARFFQPIAKEKFPYLYFETRGKNIP